jgi:hypothetical protein
MAGDVAEDRGTKAPALFCSRKNIADRAMNTNKIDRRRKGVLIVECDSAKLERQNLALGHQLHAAVKLAFPRNPVELARADTRADLLKRLGTLAETGQRYRSIVIIGHSNRNGLQLTSDMFFEWGAVARWFGPFDPHRIILIACEAGRWLPCAALFNGIPCLKEIYGSPVPTYKDQALFVLVLVLYALGAKQTDRALLQLMQAGNLLITKGLMFRNTRRDYERGGDAEGALWSAAEAFIDALMKGLRRQRR